MKWINKNLDPLGLVWMMVGYGLVKYGIVKIVFVLVSTMVCHGLKTMVFDRNSEPSIWWFGMVL